MRRRTTETPQYYVIARDSLAPDAYTVYYVRGLSQSGKSGRNESYFITRRRRRQRRLLLLLLLRTGSFYPWHPTTNPETGGGQKTIFVVVDRILLYRPSIVLDRRSTEQVHRKDNIVFGNIFFSFLVSAFRFRTARHTTTSVHSARSSTKKFSNIISHN